MSFALGWWDPSELTTYQIDNATRVWQIGMTIPQHLAGSRCTYVLTSMYVVRSVPAFIRRSHSSGESSSFHYIFMEIIHHLCDLSMILNTHVWGLTLHTYHLLLNDCASIMSIIECHENLENSTSRSTTITNHFSYAKQTSLLVFPF